MGEERAKLLETLSEGAIVHGVVKNITEYGAFVDLGGIDGLLHVTDIAWRRVSHPTEVLTVGQTVDAFRAHAQAGRLLWLAAAPEGTRRRTPGWRSGFYQVALGADVPVGIDAREWGYDHGRWGVLVDELSDASISVQNVMCGLIFDRQVGRVVFSPDVYLIATGNRTRDKSGANRVVSKLSNRTLNLTFDADLDDWIDWAQDAGIDTLLIRFLRFRPALLNAFDPDMESSPTPRQWEKVSRIPTTLERGCYIELLSGLVGEGAAAEYLGFREIIHRLPDTDDVLHSPQRAPVPRDPALLYAYVGALAEICDADNFDQVALYLRRLPPEFGVVLACDMIKARPAFMKEPG